MLCGRTARLSEEKKFGLDIEPRPALSTMLAINNAKT